MGVWRMVGRRRKEKDLMVGQIGFLCGGYGWLGLYTTGWLGLCGDTDDGYGYFRSKQTTVSTWHEEMILLAHTSYLFLTNPDFTSSRRFCLFHICHYDIHLLQQRRFQIRIFPERVLKQCFQAGGYHILLSLRSYLP